MIFIIYVINLAWYANNWNIYTVLRKNGAVCLQMLKKNLDEK